LARPSSHLAADISRRPRWDLPFSFVRRFLDSIPASDEMDRKLGAPRRAILDRNRRAVQFGDLLHN